MKTVDEIYAELMERFTERSGTAPEDSCDLSVRLYAAAARAMWPAGPSRF